MSARAPPRGALRAGSFGPQQRPLLVPGEDAVGRLGERGSIREQPEEDAVRVQDRPQAPNTGGDGRGAGDRVLDPVVGGVPRALHLEQDAVGQALGEELTSGGVAHAPRDEGVDLVLDVQVRHSPPA